MSRSTVPEDADNWDSHWGDFGVAVTASPAQAMRHSLAIQQFADEQLPPRGNVVDFGSGHGDFLSKFHQRFPGMNLLGLELSETGVQISRRKLPSAHFIAADLFTPPSTLGQYEGWGDVASCIEVLEHVDDPVLFLKAAKTYLKEDAILVVTVPGGRMSALDRVIGHRRHFDKEAIRSVLQEAGFEVTKVMLAGFPFFNLYRLMVIGRGEKLATDLRKRQRSWLVKAVLTSIGQVMHLLFHFNLRDSRFGWQVLAVARKAPMARSVGSSPGN